MTIAVFLLILIGTAFLCVAMRKHWKQVFPGVSRTPAMTAGLRALGVAFLLGAAALSSAALGIGIGLTQFFGLLTIAVFGIAVFLPYRQRG